MADIKLVWPDMPFINSGASTLHQSRALSAVTNYVFTGFYTETATTITELVVYFGTSTLTGGKIRVGLQSADATNGQPSGTWLNNGTSDVYVDIEYSSITASAWAVVNIPDYTCTRGQVMGIMIEANNSTGSWAGTLNVSSGYASTDNVPSTPWVIYKLGAGGATAQNSMVPSAYYRDANRAYLWPVSTVNTSLVISNTATDRMAGVYFSLPSGMASTFKLAGVLANSRRNAAISTMDMILYDSAGTELQAVTIDGDLYGRAATSQQWGNWFFFDESSLSTLNCGSFYRLVFKGTSSASAANLMYQEMLQANDKKSYIGADATFDWTTNTGIVPTTGWSNTTTILPGFRLVITDVTAASGGLLVHPGMAGGMRG